MARIDWRDSILLEHEVARIIKNQEEYGVAFNHGKAIYFISLLDKMKEEKYKAIRPFLDYEVINEETKDKEGNYNYVKKIRNKNGSYTASVLNWYGDTDVVDGPFSRLTIEEPSLSKRQAIIKQLLKNGWVPKEFTETGLPKLTNKGEPVDTLESVGTFGKDLADWFIYSHRQSQIRGFLEYVRPDGRISAQCDPCGTNTFRAKHRVVANIPRPTSTFGKEMRSLFCVNSGRVFVGADLSGLELRMLCHHMNDEEYTAQVLSGDIHTFNKEKAGLFTRDQAKTFIYAFL